MEFASESNVFFLYILLFIAPFVQEDTAVLGAASLSVSKPEHSAFIYAAILAGLIASDSWKYWLGWAAKHHSWAKKFAQRERVTRLKRAVLNNSVRTLIAVRFLPMARIPTYLATGFFGVPYYTYWLSIAFSAFLYVSLIFTGFHILGEIMGDKLKVYMPVIAICIAAILLVSIYLSQRRAKLKFD